MDGKFFHAPPQLVMLNVVGADDLMFVLSLEQDRVISQEEIYRNRSRLLWAWNEKNLDLVCVFNRSLFGRIQTFEASEYFTSIRSIPGHCTNPSREFNERNVCEINWFHTFYSFFLLRKKCGTNVISFSIIFENTIILTAFLHFLSRSMNRIFPSWKRSNLFFPTRIWIQKRDRLMNNLMTNYV